MRGSGPAARPLRPPFRGFCDFMSDAKVTILVSPRERFSLSGESLDSIHENTAEPFEMVYVDGGSPPHVQREIEERRRAYGFELIRTDHVLTPNEARNLGLAKVRTPWVVFVDNDVKVERGWLASLVEAGEANGADLVGPLYLQEVDGKRETHMVGGSAGFYEEDGKRRFQEEHLHFGKQASEINHEIESGPTELLEFHCMMARKTALDRHGPLDEDLLTAMEHIDLCLDVRRSGGLVWLCKESRIAYVVPPPFEATDLPYFMLRWCHEWNEHTLRHFAQKWEMDPEDPYIERELRWATSHREIALRHATWPLGRIAGWMKYHGPKAIGQPFARWFERWLVADVAKRRDAAMGRG